MVVSVNKDSCEPCLQAFACGSFHRFFFLRLGRLGLANTLATVCSYPGGSGMFACLNSLLQFIESSELSESTNAFLGGGAGLALPTVPQSQFAFLVSISGDVGLHGCPAPGTQHNSILKQC